MYFETPFALVLYAYQQLVERDRIAALKARVLDVNRAFLTMMAMNKPELLDRERAAATAAMRHRYVAAPTPDRAARQVRLDAMLARLERGRVLES